MDAAQKKMSNNKYDQILKQSKELKYIQERDDPPDVASTSPTLQIKDIDPNGLEYPIEVSVNAANSSAIIVSSGSIGLYGDDKSSSKSSLGMGGGCEGATGGSWDCGGVGGTGIEGGGSGFFVCCRSFK